MIKTPQNIKLLTNVQVVRLKRGNCRFELACYPNKILNWRAKQESNLNEVLQIDKIFADVAKGEIAKPKDLKAKFQGMSDDQIIVEILNKGEFQVSDKERENQLESLRLDIANLVAKMCVNSKDGNQFPTSILLKAMTEVNFKINPNKKAKPQALQLIESLQKVLPIERAKINLRVTLVSKEQADALKEWLNSKFAGQFVVDSSFTQSSGVIVQLVIEPALFREITTVSKGDPTFANSIVEMVDHFSGPTVVEESKE